tara:strand:+ start:2234 stop:2890 length:657 start_codon:yes stop_codon:yes gene_type:complete
MKSKIILLGAVSAMALSACSSSQDAAMPGSSDAVNVSYIYKRERVKEQISYVPEWFKEQPTDSENIFSVGTSVTPDMQFAIDAAILNAKVVLADRINSRLRSQTKQFKAKVGSGDFDSSLISELERATKNLVVDTDVSGYSVKNTEVFPHGTQYRAFVLLEYSDAEARKILTNRLRKEEQLFNRLKVTKAWKELDNAVEEEKNRDSDRRKSELNALAR